MTDIVKHTELKAVSFNADLRLTKANNEILKLLTERLKTGEPITRYDMAKLYCEVNYPSGYYKTGDYRYVDGKMSTYVREVPAVPENGWIRTQSLQWFKSNLGACILKGKLLAIPIIEID